MWGSAGNQRSIAVIDYAGGNLGSLIAALERRRAIFTVTSDPGTVSTADAAILPGDGAFAATMRALTERGLDTGIRRLIGRGKPFLGICVGMQLLFAHSVEHEPCAGIGYFPGTIMPFASAPRVPHLGWSPLTLVAPHPFVEGVRSGDYAYFLHSYRAEVGPDTVASATHGETFAAIAARDNVMATQFHPEKSQHLGARLLDNFIDIVRA